MGRRLRKIPYWLGYDIIKYNKSDRYEYQLERFLKAFPVDTVIDCGAYHGTWLDMLHSIGWRGFAIAYEPNPEAFYRLQKRIATLFTQHESFNLACGNCNEIKQLFLFDGKLARLNSLMRIDASGSTFFSELGSESTTDVKIVRLDEEFRRLKIPEGTRFFLKSDAQGYDMRVVEGLGNRLKDCTGISLEMSVQGIYEDQPHHTDVLAFMRDKGFELYGVSPVSRDNKGAMIEYDALFYPL